MTTDQTVPPERPTADGIICPRCGTAIEATNTLWLFDGKWYCKEGCVRAASSNR